MLREYCEEIRTSISIDLFDTIFRLKIFRLDGAKHNSKITSRVEINFILFLKIQLGKQCFSKLKG